MHSLLEILKFNGGLGGGGFKQECERVNQMDKYESDRLKFYGYRKTKQRGTGYGWLNIL